MNVLIIEDENIAVNRLKEVLQNIDIHISVVGICNSVKETNNWLKTNKLPDLIFLDICLNDGLSFEIFLDKNITCPVIFITAFSEYAIEAFKLHSIDYILKPYSTEEIKTSLLKFKQFENAITQKHQIEVLKLIGQSFPKNYKSRFYVKSRNDILSVETKNIAFFHFEDNATVLVNNQQKKFVLNYSLDQLETILDPNYFFRINRKFITNINGIEKMKTFSKGIIQLNLKNFEGNPLTVSKKRSKEFRMWLDK